MKLTSILAIAVLFIGCKHETVYKFKKIKLARFNDVPSVVINPAITPTKLNLGKAGVDVISVIDSNTYALIDDKKTLFVCDSNFQQLQKFDYLNTRGLNLVSPISIFKVGKTSFGVYDLTTDKIFKFSKISGQYMFDNITQMPSNLTGLVKIEPKNDSVYLATSINNVNGRYFEFKIWPKPNLLKSSGENISLDGISPFVVGLAYRASLTYNNSNQSTYLAYYNTDIIEGYNTSGQIIFRHQGPGNFTPRYKAVGSIEKQRCVFSRKAKTAFQFIENDNQYVYAFFSGNDNSLGKKQPQQIIVFDIAGNPIKRLTLSPNINFGKMMVDKVRKKIFLISNTEEKGAMVYTINIRQN